jgi:NADH:ubiquinone oxidoreductase subunit 6 (subunit J)
MSGISIIDYVLAVCVLAALVASVVMCAADAKRRGKSPLLVSLMVILFFPVGLLAWLVFRPKNIQP